VKYDVNKNVPFFITLEGTDQSKIVELSIIKFVESWQVRMMIITHWYIAINELRPKQRVFRMGFQK